MNSFGLVDFYIHSNAASTNPGLSALTKVYHLIISFIWKYYLWLT